MKIFNKRTLKSTRKKLRNNPTDAEKYLWYELRKNQLKNLKFRRQESIGNFVVDFYCPQAKLIVELDGDHHFENEMAKCDAERTKYLTTLGLKVIRFRNTDVIFNREKIITEIIKNLEEV